MKVISVLGITKSGKTSVVETVIRGLRKRNYSVGSVKEIHYEEFAIDTEGTNTDRHKKAGSQLVTALGLNETDILFGQKLGIKKLLSYYGHDYVVLEGVGDIFAPKIITAHNTKEIDERLDGCVFAISGMIAEELKGYKGLPVINCMKEPERLVQLVEEKAFSMLPNIDPKCCDACGHSCEELCKKILQGEAKREDCPLSFGAVRLAINGRDVAMAPFVQKILQNAVLGVVKELDGYQSYANIRIEIGDGFLP
jgi:molybdopterin-guanine dinucleotide biosynthesis protein B